MNSETLKLKKRARLFFKKHREVSCPAFPGEKVFFNSKGISYLFYKNFKKTTLRDLREVEARIDLLPRALKILELMPFTQEERKIERNQNEFYYFTFEAVVDRRRVKVVIRQVNKSKKYFWSVIPAWRRKKGKRVNARSLILPLE